MTDKVTVKVTKVVTEVERNDSAVKFFLTTGPSGTTIVEAYDRNTNVEYLAGDTIPPTGSIRMLGIEQPLAMYHQFHSVEDAVAWIETFYG